MLRQPVKTLVICLTVGWIRSYGQCEEVKGPRISWDTLALQWRLSAWPCLQCFKRPLDEWQALPQMLPGLCDGLFSLCCFPSCLLWPFLHASPLNGFSAPCPLEWCCSSSYHFTSVTDGIKAELKLLPLHLLLTFKCQVYFASPL